MFSYGAFHLSELAGRTSHFDDEVGFFQGFLPKNHRLPAHYLGFDRESGRIVLINSEITSERHRLATGQF